ncbi:unnamed protein product [Miscanthus lutarioriparius]|uniref:C2H2-type domain-containing protein n=1 Tax=Miscanthus lutarioriparius TaxID=422564 RepID=A0A811N2Q2_9POAL|nr:unnamed protein product [Miscanthus lutarioriparius]
MVVVEEQDNYYSDSDSDDEDVDRYVFLARQPAPPGRHAEDDDRDASSANDDDAGDDGDGKAGEEESEGGVRKTKKRPLREILDDDDAPPQTKKARLDLIIALPMTAQTAPSGSESNLASSPRAGESGSEGSHEKAHHQHRAPTPREQGEAKNATKKKRGACGKRSRSPCGEVDSDRDDVVVAAAAAAKTAGASSGATATSGCFPCSLCDRCFDSHQALGGHVLGHRKRTKIAIAVPPPSMSRALPNRADLPPSVFASAGSRGPPSRRCGVAEAP